MTHDFQHDQHAANDGADEPEGAPGGEAIEGATPGYTVIGVSLQMSAWTEIDDRAHYIHSSHCLSEALDDSAIDYVTEEAEALLRPLAEHLISLGCIRADGTHEMSFWLLFANDDSDPIDPSALFDLPRESCEHDGALSNVTLYPSPLHREFSAMQLYRSLGKQSDPASVVRQWGGPSTPDLLPRPNEPFEGWAERVAVPQDRVRRKLKRWEISGGNLKLFGICGGENERKGGGQGIQWVLPGLLQRGAVTLLVGNKEVGKSTFIAELTAKIGSELEGPHEFLGTMVAGGSVVVTVSGEDGAGVIDVRNRVYAPVYGEPLGFVIDRETARTLAEVIAEIDQMPVVDLVTLDPARAYLIGDENSSAAVSSLFDPLMDLAIRKNCAVLVTQHIGKGKPPRRLEDFDLATRGSAVYLERPRIGLAMLKRPGGIVEVGVIKNNLPPSEPEWAPRMQGRLFTQNPATLTLEPVDGQSDGSVAKQPNELRELILGALAGQNAAGQVVRRTGQSEIYELRLGSLAGLSRAAIRAEVSALIAEGEIADTEAGLITKRSIS